MNQSEILRENVKPKVKNRHVVKASHITRKLQTPKSTVDRSLSKDIRKVTERLYTQSVNEKI